MWKVLGVIIEYRQKSVKVQRSESLVPAGTPGEDFLESLLFNWVLKSRQDVNK